MKITPSARLYLPPVRREIVSVIISRDGLFLVVSS